MRTAKVIITFLGAFFAYHIFFGCAIFSANEEGVLQAPAWYPFVGIAISTIPAYLVSKKKSKFTKKSFRWNTDKDIAAKAILKHGQASASVIQLETGWDPKRASKALEQLEKIGAVGPINGENTREILIDQ